MHFFSRREAVVLCVDGGEEIQCERGDEKDVDQRNDPFENRGSIVVVLFLHDAES